MADPYVFVDIVTIQAHPLALKKGFRKWIKDALRKAVKRWHKTIYPRKFKAGAVGRYNLKPRADRFRRRAARGKGRKANPRWREAFIHTGLLEDMSVPGTIKVTGKPTLVRGKLTVPWYVHLRRRFANAPDLGLELIRTTRGEARFLGKFIDVKIRRQIRKMNLVEEMII
jgi:hypothetical protein